MNESPFTPLLKLRSLSGRQIERIHLASLEILESQGMRFLHPGAKELLLEHGAKTGPDGLVRIPAGLVEKAIETAPAMIEIYDRCGNPAMRLGQRNVYFGTGSDTPQTFDPESRALRKSTKRDSYRMAKFVDAMPQLDFVMSMAIADDYPGSSSFVHQFDAMLTGTAKPIVYTAQGGKDLQPIHEIMCAQRGSAEAVAEKPFAVLYTEPIPPRLHTREALEMIMFCARHGLPVVYPTGSMAGGTAPVTLAGAIALGNAECLAGLAVHQLTAPGAPFIYGGNVTAMDMHWAGYTYASPEFHFAFSAFGDLAHHYRLPVWGLAGASDSKTLDAQAGAEASHQILLALLAGENLVHDVGYLGSGMISSMEMIFFCNEVIGMLRKATSGFEVTDETLALSVTRRVGAGGHFLQDEHTLKHCREIWMPSVFDRQPLAQWKTSNPEDLIDTLNQRVRQVLLEHRAPDIEVGVRREIDEILCRREKAEDIL
ncbi:MAG: trimethylamine methyltransferase family protein [Candidatus Glassbacteria bacterium]